MNELYDKNEYKENIHINSEIVFLWGVTTSIIFVYVKCMSL